jgi:hypothetical protein
MKPLVVSLLCCLTVGLWVVTPVWAKCERLHAEVQARVHEATAEKQEPQRLVEAKRCAEDGMKQHRQGQHWEAMQTLRRCLTMLE